MGGRSPPRPGSVRRSGGAPGARRRAGGAPLPAGTGTRSGPAGRRPSGRGVGPGIDGGRNRRRTHRSGLRSRGLRPGPTTRPGRAGAHRRGRPLPGRLRVAHRSARDRGRYTSHRLPAPLGPADICRPADAPLPAVLALLHPANPPRRRRVVHRLRPDPPTHARRGFDGGVAAGALRPAHGRLAGQHGRLVHQPQALLGPAPAVLLLPRRSPHCHLVQAGAARSGHPRLRATAGAAPTVDRRSPRRLQHLRRRSDPGDGSGRLLAGRRRRSLLHPRLAQPPDTDGWLRPGRGRRADPSRSARPRPLGVVVPCPGGLRCTNRCGCGSTPFCS